MDDLLNELRSRIIDTLKLDEVAPGDITAEEPLFGEGLGLDSIDALELVVMVEKHYGIVIEDRETGRAAFESLTSLARFITSNRPG